MRNYNAVWREPHVFQYKNLNIISMPLPSSGGICLNQILKMIEPFDVGQYKHNSKEYVKILVEAQKRSFADRSNFLGDSDFVNVEIKKLVNNSYLESIKPKIKKKIRREVSFLLNQNLDSNSIILFKK